MQIDKLVRPCIERSLPYPAGKPIDEIEAGLGQGRLLRLGHNENPLGTSPLALEAMAAELSRASRYPESSCPDLTRRLAGLHRVSPDQIFIDNGLDGVITMIGLTFINPGDEVIYSQLTFPAYENIATKMDGRCVPVPLASGYRIDADGMVAAITPRTKLVFLCNPNNPTGTIVDREAFSRLLAALPDTALLVSDEAYYDFSDDPAYPQTLPLLAGHPNLVILRTFSKLMGLAGMRVGYALAHPAVVAALFRVRAPFPVNRIAQAGAAAALDDRDFINQTLAVVRAGRAQLSHGFEQMGLKYCPSQGNFVFVDVGRPARPVAEALLSEGVLVRAQPAPGQNCLRITVGLPEENDRVLAVLDRVLAGQ